MHTHTFQHCVQRCCKQCLNSSIQPTNKGCIFKSLVLFPSHINHRAKFMLQKSSMHVCRILVKWFQLTVFFSTITADLSVLKIMNQENKILKYVIYNHVLYCKCHYSFGSSFNESSQLTWTEAQSITCADDVMTLQKYILLMLGNSWIHTLLFWQVLLHFHWSCKMHA